MSVIKWAEEEIEIAMRREVDAIKNSNEDDKLKEMSVDYAGACYISALKAYKSLVDDDHSGCSYGITVGILKRLLDGYPLTPIEDVPEVWNLVHETEALVEYQCKRCSSLFKKVNPQTGEVTYSDVESIVCVGEDGTSWYNGFVAARVRELHPITMPYYPTGRIYVSEVGFSTKGNDDEYDTLKIEKIKMPDGTVEVLNWFYKEDIDGDKFVRISSEEYIARYAEYTNNKAKKEQEKAE